MPRSTRGLASIPKLRELRKQRPHERPSAKLWGFVVLGLLSAVAIHVALSRRAIGQQKGTMLAKQRALAATIGPRWESVRGTVIDTAIAAAKEPWAGDQVDASLRARAWRSETAVYLRLGSNEAQTAETVLEATKLSPRDAFLSCLRTPTVAPGADRLGRFHRMQESFAVTRLLEPTWVDDVQNADDDLRLRVFTEQLAAATPEALETAVTLVERAKLVLVVIDEMPTTDGAPARVEDVQRSAHGLRVTLVDRGTRMQLARIRVEPNVALVPGGEGRVSDDDARAAIERQAIGCSAARLFDDAVDQALAPR
jgi:hypothetical protein